MNESIARTIGDRIIANLWTAGHEITTSQKSEIRSAGWKAAIDPSDIDAGMEAAVRDHLRTMGYEPSDARSPRMLGVAEQIGHVPMPGDAVELQSEWSCVKAGGILHLAGPGAADSYTIGAGRHYMVGNRVNQSSGGPASIARLPASCLKPTDRRMEAWFWRFRNDTPEAGAGVDYLRSVRVWEWSGDDEDFDRIPRPYQSEAIAVMKKDKTATLVLPAGAGKTAVSASASRDGG